MAGTTSGTYNFAPSIAQTTLYAYNMCGIRPTALLQEHMESARMAANFVFTDWANKGVNLWQVAPFTVPLVQGTATYSLLPNIVNILDLYITVTAGTSSTNRYILPVSRTEFVSYANPSEQGFPTSYWHNRTLSPTINFYPTPDGNEVSFTYYAMLQMQDASLANGQIADIPAIWQNAFVKALAAELAISWAPDRAMPLAASAAAAWETAAITNVETSSLYVSPTMSGYWRA